MGNKFVKSVSFNITNKDDEIILKAVKRRNFSGYVKKLIMADIQAKQLAKEPPQIDEVKTDQPIIAKKEVIEHQKPKAKKESSELTIEQLQKRQQQGKSSAPKVFNPNN